MTLKGYRFHFRNVSNVTSLVGEVVFGVEDGIVSTLGAVSGIAIGTGDKYTVLLSGMVIIAVESISMAIGTYISSNASREIDESNIEEEKQLLQNEPTQEKKELFWLLVRDGWSKDFAGKIAQMAQKNDKVLLREHEYRELGIFPFRKDNPIKRAYFMFFSYIVGGIFPLSAYMFFPIQTALYLSVISSLIGLFLLGSFTTRYTHHTPIKAGIRFMTLGSIAFLIGTLIGHLASGLQ